jgi:hypothetical protein
MHEIRMNPHTFDKYHLNGRSNIDIEDTIFFVSDDKNIVRHVMNYLEKNSREPKFEHIISYITCGAYDSHDVKQSEEIFEMIEIFEHVDDEMKNIIYIEGLINATIGHKQHNASFEGPVLTEIRNHFNSQTIV